MSEEVKKSERKQYRPVLVRFSMKEYRLLSIKAKTAGKKVTPFVRDAALA